MVEVVFPIQALEGMILLQSEVSWDVKVGCCVQACTVRTNATATLAREELNEGVKLRGTLGLLEALVLGAKHGIHNGPC